ncbi:hypothetical protein ABPG72_008437 [Tetrahymena utriculariae]
MSEILNDQLTDPSSSSIFNSTSQYDSSSIVVHPNNQQNLKSLNQAYNTFDTQTVDINNNNPIKITENFESIDYFQYSADTITQQATIKQAMSTESQQIKYQKLKDLPDFTEQKINQLNQQNQSCPFIENQSNLISDTTISQSNSKIISDDESEYNFHHHLTTKNLSNQRIETFPDASILEGQYQRLDLSSNELSRMNKNIPNGVNQLILNNNRFAFLTNLQGSSLTLIELKNNRLISVQGIKICQNLRYLDVSNNFLSDDQLEDLKELKELETLLMRHNHLKDESIIDYFHDNKNLKTLDLSQNDLEDIVIQQNCYVKKLYLQQNKIESFKVINNQANKWRETQHKVFLQKIDISLNGLQYFDTKYLISVRELILSDNSLLDLDLSNNLKIKKVDLNRNQLSNIKFKENEIYMNLKQLFISNNRIVKISFISQHLQALEDLDISNNNIDDHNHFFDNISKLKNLMKLNMEGNPFDQEAKLIQKSLEQKEKNYCKNNEIQYKLEKINDQDQYLKHKMSLSPFETNKEESKILNSHFTSVSNRKLQFQYNSQDNNSNLLNCQLSPDIFKSIDQQYITQKSEIQQSLDQSTYLPNKKNMEENMSQHYNNSQNYDQDNKNYSNNFKKEKKEIYCINEEEEEANLRESNQKQNEILQQKLFSDQVFELNLFKKKINQSQDQQLYESEAKILNDQLNFSIIDEEEFSYKNLQSKRGENFSQLEIDNQDQTNQTFRKRCSTNKFSQIDTNRSELDNTIGNNQFKQYPNTLQCNLQKDKNFHKSANQNQQFDQSQKENNLNYSNRTFNEIDEEDRQLKLAIETMESSLTDGSLLSEITNEMNREYRKNLNQLKEYYKDRKSKKSLRKEDGETLLQMNQALMQKIINKLGDDPNLLQNPYYIKCKQLLEQNFQTFEPSLDKNKSKFNSNRNNQLQYKSIQQKQQLACSSNDQTKISKNYFISSPKFQQAMEEYYQNDKLAKELQKNLTISFQNKNSSKNTSLCSQRQENNLTQNEQNNNTRQSVKVHTTHLDSQAQHFSNNDKILFQDENCMTQGIQQNRHIASNIQSSSLMSTQEQASSVFLNANCNQNRNAFKKQTDQSCYQHSRNNSNNSTNNQKEQSLFENSNIQNDFLCSQPLFSDTSQIPIMTNNSPFINNINKKLYSQSSRLPSYEVDQQNKIAQYQQQQNQTCRLFSNERNKTYQHCKNNNNQNQFNSFYSQNQDSNFSIFISEDEFFKVFQEYLIADDINQKCQQNNKQSVTVRKKFIKLIIREVLSNCDVYYSTQTIEQIIQNIMPFVENKENIRFDQLYNIFTKNIQSYSDQFAYNYTDYVAKSQHKSGYVCDTQQERINSQLQSYQEKLEDRIKTPPQIITFRGKLRESSYEKKRSNTLQSNYEQLSSQNLLTNGNLKSQRSIQQKLQTQEQDQEKYFDEIYQQQKIQKLRELSPLPNNRDNSYIFRQYQDQSLCLPTNNQGITYGECSFLSSNNQMNTLINNERSNASFELFLQKKKCYSQLATPKSNNPSIPKSNQINLSYEDFYSHVSPQVNYILELSSVNSLKIQNSPLTSNTPIPHTQISIKQIKQNSDEFKSVELLLNQLKFQVYRMVKCVNQQALQVQQAKKQKMMKTIQNFDQTNKVIASYINNYTLQFFDYIVLFHSTGLTQLGKILETSFLKYYGESPTVFSLKKNIAIQEQEKYFKKKKFNISTQNQTFTNISDVEGQKSKWRIIVSKVYLGKCLTDSTSTIDTFDMDNSLEYIIEQGYTSIFFEKSDAYFLFDNTLAYPLYLCEYFNTISI